MPVQGPQLFLGRIDGCVGRFRVVRKQVRRPENMNMCVARAGRGNEGRLRWCRMRRRRIFHNKTRKFETTGFKAYSRQNGKSQMSAAGTSAGLAQAERIVADTDDRILFNKVVDFTGN